MGSETIIGRMENHILEIGQKTKWMAMAFCLGKTEKNMKAISQMTNVKVKANLFGLMVGST